AKLKFIRGTLDRYRRIDLHIRRVPFAPLRRALDKAYHLDDVRPLLDANPMGAAVYEDAVAEAERFRALLVRAAIGTAATLGMAPGGRGWWRHARTAVAQAAPAAAPVAVAVAALEPSPAASSAAPVSGLAPSAVWLVEKGPGWEQYSNGLRVDTGYSV